MRSKTARQLRNRLYYELKPLIPRSLQILIRRALASRIRAAHSHVWPIDERAAHKPEDWSGWPDQKQFAFILMHDVESDFGQSKCRELMGIERKMGFRSLFSFVPEGYTVSSALRRDLVREGFEVGVHGLKHDGKLFASERSFTQQAKRINHYLKEWDSVGFVSPSMHRNLTWMHKLNIEYSASTFDTDPFEPQPDGVRRIFPFVVNAADGYRQYVELPYTLPQDFTMFVILKHNTIDPWKEKLDWIADKGGMALLITHPDYMSHENGRRAIDEYPAELYEEFLEYIREKHGRRYWHPLPKEMARFWKVNMAMEKDVFRHRDGQASG